MNDAMSLVLSGSAGVSLGLLFFGGLWWTVRRGLSSKRPALWFAGSLLLRTGIVLAGFYFVGSGHWERLLACLVGFIVARLLVAWLTRPSGTNPARAAQETSHAP